MSEPKPMNKGRIQALRVIAERAAEPGEWRAVAGLGRMEVAVFVDGRRTETIVKDVDSLVWRAEMLAFDAHDLAELLADRDFWEAEAKRWRDRAPVQDGDPELQAFTIERGHAFCQAAGLHRIRETHTYETGLRGARIKLNCGAARAITDLAFCLAKTPWEILDEMAAMEDPS